jgi:hypothetical protein
MGVSRMEEAGRTEVVKRTTKRKQAKSRPIIEQLLERNAWNPFERVDPKTLERLHKKHQQTARKFLLDDTEEAPF